MDTATNEQIMKVRDELKVVQPMIDISADRLNGLRTQCATSVDLTRQEIRTLEGKLLKMFARQLVTKSKLRGAAAQNIFRDTPSVRQWLQVVGLQTDSIEGICERVDSIEALQEKSDHDLNNILKDRKANANELRKLHRALYNLKRYTDILLRGDNNTNELSDLELYWDSWERHRDKTSGSLSPHTSRNRSLTDTQHTAEDDFSSKLSCNNYNNNNNNNRSSAESLSSLSSRVQSPPPTPTSKKSAKYISTPPPRKKHQALKEIIGLLPASFPLTKSKSHESQLSGKAPDAKDIPSLDLLTTQPRRGRLPTEPGLTSHSELGSYTPSSPSRSPVSQKTSPDITSPSASLAHLSTTSSSIPPNSPQICSYSSSSSSVHNPNRIINSYESSSTLPNSKIASPVNVSPNLSNPLSPVLFKRSPAKYLMGSTHSQKIKHDSSPLALHSTNSPVTLSPIKSLGQDDEFYHREDDEFKKWEKRDSKEDKSQATSIHIRHEINHRFTKIYKMYAKCDYCDRQMLFETGLRCRECKFKCHRECEHHVPPSCGLPSEYMDEFKRRMIPTDSEFDGESDGNNFKTSTPVHQNSQPSSQRKRKLSHPPSTTRHGDSGTIPINGKSGSHPSSPAFGSRHSPSNNIHFSYPDVDRELLAKSVDKNTRTEEFNDSEKAVSASDSGGSGSMDSDKNTARVDSQESQISDTELVIDENIRNSQRWPRQNSQLSMREWDIPYDELKIEEPIGIGRFGTVYRGNWHGDVAIKLLNMDYMDDDKALEAFKSEVGTFRKTRHENLVLFMGACMKPPRLAIVTSLSKGMTLYTHIHLRKDKFNMNKTTIVAQQITQGMGYLHARGIVHKDLKSKNIFLENGKVVITDFGLFSVTKLCYGNGKANTLNIPPGWLCYLAPEIVRSLRINQVHHELPFSKASDLYAFGTVWYELLCGEWPFKGQPPEAVIWQVGKGMKQPLANLQASRDVKDILMLCWTFRPENRPDFGELFNLLEKLPKKRLARSPSHPVHLSRSAESVF